MGKSTIVRVIYIVIAIVGIIMLYLGHQNHRANQIILGTGLVILALFISHYPLSWMQDYGLSLYNN